MQETKSRCLLVLPSRNYLRIQAPWDLLVVIKSDSDPETSIDDGQENSESRKHSTVQSC